MIRLFQGLSRWLADNTSVFIICIAVFTFFFPHTFDWVRGTTQTVILGIIMLTMGLTLTTDDFKILARRPLDIFIGACAQFIIMPGVAYMLVHVWHLDPALALGILLVGCCPGGTASNVIAYIAKGDVPLSVGMTITSTLIAPLVTPVLVYLLAGSWVEVSFMAMVLAVVKIVLLPVLAGIILNSLFHETIVKLGGILPLVSVVAIVTIIDGIVAVNAAKLMSCGLIVMLAVVLHNGIGMALGLAMARLMKVSYAKETSIAIEVAMQNSGLALALATANFAANPLATLPGAIFSIWHNVSGSIFASCRIKEVEEKQKLELKEHAIAK